MVKNFQKRNLRKKKKYKYKPPPTTLWDMLDEKSKQKLLQVRAKIVKK